MVALRSDSAEVGGASTWTISVPLAQAAKLIPKPSSMPNRRYCSIMVH